MSKSKDTADFLKDEIFNLLYFRDNTPPSDSTVKDKCKSIVLGLKNKHTNPKKIKFWDKVLRHI